MKADLRAMLPKVLEETGFPNEKTLNAKIGGKAADFIDLFHEVIYSPDQYVSLYMKGFKSAKSPPGSFFENAHDRNFAIFQQSKAAQEYFVLFLKRSYLKHFDELSRVRPHLSESEVWIGQNNADYGLLITPRFVNKKWENDRSEIRHFRKLYWTIGHVLESGLVIQDDPDKVNFETVEAYLTFFKNTLVRASGSRYEKAIAQNYIEFVRASDEPERVPLLIPEYRYDGPNAQHRYRLDFCIIDPFTMRKVGYELSPWSTHGYLTKIKGLTQKKINEMAKDNFEKEMSKHRAFFKKHDIFVLIYTDTQLANTGIIFEDMKRYLVPVDKVSKLDFALVEKFFN